MGRRTEAIGRAFIAMVGSLCLLALVWPTAGVAHSGDDLGEYASIPPTIDGDFTTPEYEKDCISINGQALGLPDQTPGYGYLLTVCEVNDDTNDYWALAINDFTEDNSDAPLLWFDNNHDGIVEAGVNNACAPYGGDVEDVFGAFGGFFADGYYCNVPPFTVGLADGGPINGAMARDHDSAGWVYEFSHPLDSPDSDDYSLTPGDTTGWCLTYDDKSNATDSYAFGELQYPVGCWADLNSTEDAIQGKTAKYGDLLKETAAHDVAEVIKEKLKGLVATCKWCPPDPKAKLLERVNEIIRVLELDRVAAGFRKLNAFAELTRNLIRAGELPQRAAKRRFLDRVPLYKQLLKGSTPPAGPLGPGAGVGPGGARAGTIYKVNSAGGIITETPPPPPPRG